MKSVYRICNGFLWRWESGGDYVRATKLCEIYGDSEDFAEALVDEINKKDIKIVYNINTK
jgi:hypothetical protein